MSVINEDRSLSKAHRSYTPTNILNCPSNYTKLLVLVIKLYSALGLIFESYAKSVYYEFSTEGPRWVRLAQFTLCPS